MVPIVFAIAIKGAPIHPSSTAKSLGRLEELAEGRGRLHAVSLPATGGAPGEVLQAAVEDANRLAAIIVFDAVDEGAAIAATRRLTEFVTEGLLLFVERPGAVALMPVKVNRLLEWFSQFVEKRSAREICGFDEVQLRRPAGAPEAMYVVDMGEPTHHEITGQLTYVGVRDKVQAGLPHGGAVAGVVAGSGATTGLRGCCTAHIVYHNVFQTSASNEPEFSPLRLYQALDAFVTSTSRVLNFSLGCVARDSALELLFSEAALREKVVVAALPHDTTFPPFPADLKSVIAVGATTDADVAAYTAVAGCSAWISAPGKRVRVLGLGQRIDREDGTSFAAPVVAAAVWLALEACASLTLGDVRDLLRHSIHRPPPAEHPDRDMGFGRLDMRQLAVRLAAVCGGASVERS